MRAQLDSGERVDITTVAERPHLAGAAFDAGEWPEFMRHNRVAEAYFWRTTDAFADICLIAAAGDGAVVADAHAVRFAADAAGRECCPAGGWEQVVVWAFDDARRNVVADTACALNISVAAKWQGRGLAGLMLRALREAVQRSGVDTLVAPVRPPSKAREPRTPMATYAAAVRDDGGGIEVPGALAPVHCDTGADHAVYVEPQRLVPS